MAPRTFDWFCDANKIPIWLVYALALLTILVSLLTNSRWHVLIENIIALSDSGEAGEDAQ